MISDEELMAAYVDGRRAAFDELYRRYAPSLRAMFVRALSCRADASDLLQGVFLNLHRFRASYRRGSAFRPWLVSIARNLLRDRVRHGQRRPEVLVEHEVLARFAEVEAPNPSCPREHVRAALAALRPGARHVVERHWFAGEPFERIAADLGISTVAARLRAHRGYTELRAALRGDAAPGVASVSNRSRLPAVA
jgi:RNA polymerase sigma-70 factor (ECF subfamily)